MLLAQALGFGIVLPALVALGLGFSFARASRSLPVLGRSGPAMAIAFAYLVAHLGLHGFRGWFPTDVMQRLPLVALGAAAVASLDGAEATFTRRITLDVLIAAATALLLLSPLSTAFGASRLLLSALGLVAVTVVVSRSLHALFDQQRRGLLALGLSGLAGLIALLCGATGTAMVAQLTGAIAASIAGLAALLLLLGARHVGSLDAATRVVAALLMSGLTLAHFYAEMPGELALAAALALAAPGAFRWAIKQHPRLSASLGWAASLLALAFAGWGAMGTHTSPAVQPAGDYDYGYQ
jgi:hypothetical protein